MMRTESNVVYKISIQETLFITKKDIVDMFGGKIEINQINYRKENYRQSINEKIQDEVEIGHDKKCREYPRGCANIGDI